MLKERNIMVAVMILLTFGLAFSLLPLETVKAETLEIIDEDITKTAGDLEIPVGTAVNGNVTLNLGELTVNGIVNGDVDNNMGEVKITGEVIGNVAANLGQVTVDGFVSGNTTARMGEIIINGSVGGNVEAGLGSTVINGSVGGNLDSGFGDLTVNGSIDGDVNSKGGNIYLKGIVNGDVYLDRGVVELGPGSRVTGTVSVGKGLVKKDSTATTGAVEIAEEVSASELQENGERGSYRFHGLDRNPVERITERTINTVNSVLGRFGIMIPGFTGRPEISVSPFMRAYGNIARGILNMLILFALATLTFVLFPQHVKTAGNAVTEKTGPVLGWGILASILAIPLMILLAITIIGIPLILLEIIFLAAAGLLGYTGLAELIGRRIFKSTATTTPSSIGTIALGVVIIGLVAMIPILGGIFSLAVFIIALGAALATRFGTIKHSGTAYIQLKTKE